MNKKPFQAQRSTQAVSSPVLPSRPAQKRPKASALLMAAGIGLCAVIPAQAARVSEPKPQPQNLQQVSQAPRTLELTLT